MRSSSLSAGHLYHTALAPNKREANLVLDTSPLNDAGELLKPWMYTMGVGTIRILPSRAATVAQATDHTTVTSWITPQANRFIGILRRKPLRAEVPMAVHCIGALLAGALG